MENNILILSADSIKF